MQFLLDHDVPSEIGRVLARDGHDVALVRNLLAPDASDIEVFRCASVNRRILLTCNRDDFLALAKQEDHDGLIVVIRRRTRIAECSAVIRLIEKAGPTGIAKNINFA